MNILSTEVQQQYYQTVNKNEVGKQKMLPTCAVYIYNYVIFWLIMNSKAQNKMLPEHNQLQQGAIEIKKFVQDAFQIDYVNTSKIIPQLPHCSQQVKVNNYLCYQSGQFLYKITEILYEDKLIRIQDKFEVKLDPTHLSSRLCVTESNSLNKKKNCSRSIQKIRIFHKNPLSGNKPNKKDKKNIVKNVIKIFASWLEKKSNLMSSCSYSLASQELKKLSNCQNFNNRLIQKVIEAKQINKTFLEFLEDSAEQQIKSSRIKDKQSHYEALQIYKNLLQGIDGRSSRLSHSSTSSSPSQSSDSNSSEFIFDYEKGEKNNSSKTGTEEGKKQTQVQSKREQDINSAVFPLIHNGLPK